jgi:hypothetical protein
MHHYKILIGNESVKNFRNGGLRKGKNGEKALIVDGNQAVKLELNSKKSYP